MEKSRIIDNWPPSTDLADDGPANGNVFNSSVKLHKK
jgi:hypothetical protein